MLGLGLIILGMLLLRVWAVFLGGVDREGAVIKEDACKPHSWSYNKDDKLECLKCCKVAGFVYEEESE